MLVTKSDSVGAHVRNAVSKHTDMEIIVDVKDGVGAVSAIRHQVVDAVILDIGEANQNLKVTLSRLFRVDPEIKVIMVASLSFSSVKASMRGLMEGAVEFIPTPTAHTKVSSTSEFAARLATVVRALGANERAVEPRGGVHRQAPPRVRPAPVAEPAASIILRPVPAMVPRVLAVGSSTGGPQALFTFIATLPPDLEIPVLITQHMPPTFTSLLAEHISKHSGRQCREGVDGEAIVAGRLYLAPGDRHMRAERVDGQATIRLDSGPPVNFCRPSVDPMFASLPPVYGDKILGVMLTGMGSDGRDGSRTIVEAGGMIVAQDEASSVVWGMPRAVAEAGLCSAVLSLDELAPFVGRFLTKDRLAP